MSYREFASPNDFGYLYKRYNSCVDITVQFNKDDPEHPIHCSETMALSGRPSLIIFKPLKHMYCWEARKKWMDDGLIGASDLGQLDEAMKEMFGSVEPRHPDVF